MHKQHVDKKYKVVSGNVATQTSTVGASRDDAITKIPAGIIEEGKIFFFYRPCAGLHWQEAHNLGDMQHFYMVMLPLSRPAPVRLIVVGKKRLPEKGQCFWATVVAVAKPMDDVLKGLGPKDNRLVTSGGWLTPSAKLVGEGIYFLVKQGREMDLLYELEIPVNPRKAQELGIDKTGGLTVLVKNPCNSPPYGTGPAKNPGYPKELQQQMFHEGPLGEYAWLPPKNPALLDYEDAEFILIGHSPDTERKEKSIKELLDKAKEADLGTVAQWMEYGVWVDQNEHA